MLKPKEQYELKAQGGWREYRWDALMECLREHWIYFRGYQQLVDLIERHQCQRILDVGCGVISVFNLLREDFPRLQLVGIDPLLTQYRELYKLDETITWHDAYGEAMPFPDESFDPIISSNSIDHCESMHQTLGEISRVLKANGILHLSTHLYSPSQGESDRGVGHPHNPTRESLKQLLDQHRVDIVNTKLRRVAPGVRSYAALRIKKGYGKFRTTLQFSVSHFAKSLAKEIRGRGCLGEWTIIGCRRGALPRAQVQTQNAQM